MRLWKGCANPVGAVIGREGRAAVYLVNRIVPFAATDRSHTDRANPWERSSAAKGAPRCIW